MSSSGPDPRSTKRQNRFLAGLTVVICERDTEYQAEAINLSRDGALVEVPGRPPSWPMVTLKVSTVAGDLTLECATRVVHLHEEGDSSQIGLQFEVLTQDETTTLEAIVSRIIEGTAPAPLHDLPENASPTQIREALEKIPLPHRMILAGRGLAQDRAVLRHDPNPQVLVALARNPHMSVIEATQLARNRQLLPTGIESMARDPRWASNAEIKILLATHPKTPLQLAEKIAGTLNRIALEKLVRTPGLNPALRTRLGLSLPQRADRWT